MDSRLNERLTRWHAQIETLEAVELKCLALEASEKTMWSKLFLSAEGKNVAEREAKAYVSGAWIEFLDGLVSARVEYNKEKRILELKQSAFQAEYLQAKHESEAIARFPKAVT